MSDEKFPVDVANDKILKIFGWEDTHAPVSKADLRDALNELWDQAPGGLREGSSRRTMSKPEEFLHKHAGLVARLLEDRIKDVRQHQNVARQNYWGAIERACAEEISELEAVLSELERT